MKSESHKVLDFTSGHKRAQSVTVCFAIIIVIDLILIIFSYLEIQLINRALEGEIITEEEAIANDIRQGFMGITYMILYTITAILFLVWIHRAHRNLPSLGVEGLKYSPGWAVGGFFVPILSLFRPFQVVTEIWKASDPTVGLDDSTAWQNARTSPMVISWWLLFIISGLVGWTIFRLSLRAESLEEMLTASWLYLLINIVEIPAAILVIKVVRIIDSRQERKHLDVRPVWRRITSLNNLPK